MGDNDDIARRPPDAYVAARINDPGTGRRPSLTLVGLLGDSDRAGCRRLYLTTRLDYFVEFRTAEVVVVEDVAPAEPPFPGLDATRVTLVGEATVDWVRRATGSDPFLLEARDAVTLPAEVTDLAHTWEANCPRVTHRFGHSDFEPCRPGGGGTGGGTFGPWPTRAGPTCGACTQDSCATCGENTCNSCWGGTCVTCQGARCATMPGTCQTCGRATCEPGCTNTGGISAGGTCDATCASCPGFTCENTCVSCRGTCDPSCGGSCRATCEQTCETCAGTCLPTVETCHTCHFVTCDCRVSDPAWCLIRA